MMDTEEYKRNYVVTPPPAQKYLFDGVFNMTLFYESFTEALAFYTQVLGPPGYVEGDGTRGWQIGSGWLTLLKGNNGNPTNVEMMFKMGSPDEAERLQQAFLEAGATGPAPSTELMYDKVRYCPVRDPFGVDILVFAPV